MSMRKVVLYLPLLMISRASRSFERRTHSHLSTGGEDFRLLSSDQYPLLTFIDHPVDLLSGQGLAHNRGFKIKFEISRSCTRRSWRALVTSPRFCSFAIRLSQ